MELSNYLKKVEEIVYNLKDRHTRISQNDCLISFRGENKDYGKTKLMPSLFRDSEHLVKEKYLFELLGDYGVLKKGQESNIEKAIEAQHYVAISRMLDITFDFLTAVFFACKGEEDEDGIVYIFCFPEYYSPHSQYIEDFYSGILDDENILYPCNFKVISHCYSNERIKAQNGGFIFFPGKEFRNVSEIYYEKILISKDDKSKILDELDLIFNMTEATIFPEKEKVIDIIRKKFSSDLYHRYSIDAEGEIKAYFDRIDYELSLRNFDNDIEFLRFLRKEKSDLLYYVNQIEVQNPKNKTHIEVMKKEIEADFKYLLLKHKRG